MRRSSPFRPPARCFLILALAFAPAALPARESPEAPPLAAPADKSSLRFLVFGDSGTGERRQYELGQEMNQAREVFPFELALMLGDNLYGGGGPDDYEKKFSQPYKALLDAGVEFRAALGNHDDPNERFFKPFNMGSDRYYTFKPSRQSVRFFALDSNYMNPEQVAWLRKELAASREAWKICFFHHPIYSSGSRHGSDKGLRAVLEPLFIQYGVNVVLAGHEHMYERLKPQNGVYYFTSGAGGKLGGGTRQTGLTETAYERQVHFMLFEIAGDELRFQAVNHDGRQVDSGVIRRAAPSTGSPGSQRAEGARTGS